jgi:hypothetical protein
LVEHFDAQFDKVERAGGVAVPPKTHKYKQRLVEISAFLICGVL